MIQKHKFKCARMSLALQGSLFLGPPLRPGVLGGSMAVLSSLVSDYNSQCPEERRVPPGGTVPLKMARNATKSDTRWSLSVAQVALLYGSGSRFEVTHTGILNVPKCHEVTPKVVQSGT